MEKPGDPEEITAIIQLRNDSGLLWGDGCILMTEPTGFPEVDLKEEGRKEHPVHFLLFKGGYNVSGSNGWKTASTL